MEHKTVIVIGAVNVDICGRPTKAPNMHDSNPGQVSISSGGVGRNIAHNLRLLGADVKLVAAIGNDILGDSIYKSCTEIGLDMSMCRRIKGARTSTYLYVTDEKGEMITAVNDMDIAASITPSYLSLLLENLNSADAVVIDGNLSAETIKWIGENVTAPLYADPVSTVKAERIKPILGRLTAFKPNDIEAMSMTGESTSLFAAEALLGMGVKRVFVSLGAKGIVAAEGGEVIKLPCGRLNVVNTTGCGDAATAAIVWAGINGLDLAETADAAMKAAAMAIECEETVNPDLCAELIM